MSDKKDLTPSEISVVARRLIKNDSVIYFLNNCRLIYESLMPSIVQQPLVYNSIEESVIAAFDTIQNLVNRKHIYRLLLRFIYIHLVRVIDIYRAAAAKDRVEGQVSRGVEQRDITIAIDIYLAAKDSKGGLSRTKLLNYCRRGKRWSFLTGPSPISVFIFSPTADTIIYVLPPLLPILLRRDSLPQRQNNSITDPTIQSLTAHVWHGNPELVRVLIEVGQFAGLAPSRITRGVPRIEDVVTRTNHAFSPLLCNIL